MSQLSDFYTLKGTDHRNRSYIDICSFDWKQLEGIHDYIQWLFPLREESKFNPDAPLLDDRDVELIRSDLVEHAFLIMCDFYGCTYQNGVVKIHPDTWMERSEDWVMPGNHNFLRITRILKSLSLLNLRTTRNAFYAFLDKLYWQHRTVITKETMGHWRSAAGQ